MADDHHTWILGTEPPTIRAHSLAKHRLIENYLSRYVEVLTGNPKIPAFNLTLVDGFAGGGLYLDSETREERAGSPLLMLKAMSAAAADAQTKRPNRDFNLDVEYYFIEQSPDAFAFLTDQLQRSEFSSLIGGRIQTRNSTFVSQVDKIVQRIKERGGGNRAIFVLDQCGYKDVPFAEIRSILSQLDRAEIILTFATDFLVDYLRSNEASQKTLEKVGLRLSADAIHDAKQKRGWRKAIQVMLHQQIIVHSGAKHYTPFFLRSKDSHRDFWLIHLSNHERARDVMVGLHWLENTSFTHYGRSGLFMLGYDPDEDFTITGERSLPEFRFDHLARVSTLDCLKIELPEQLHRFKDGVTFKQLFALLTNGTPATSELFRRVLADMTSAGMVDVRDKTGLVKRVKGVQHPTDIIVPSRQRRLFIPGS